MLCFVSFRFVSFRFINKIHPRHPDEEKLCWDRKKIESNRRINRRPCQSMNCLLCIPFFTADVVLLMDDLFPAETLHYYTVACHSFCTCCGAVHLLLSAWRRLVLFSSLLSGWRRLLLLLLLLLVVVWFFLLFFQQWRRLIDTMLVFFLFFCNCSAYYFGGRDSTDDAEVVQYYSITVQCTVQCSFALSCIAAAFAY